MHIFLSGTSVLDIVSLHGPKYVHSGENISLNCSFSSSEAATTAWLKQTPGEKPLLVTSAYYSRPAVYHNGFDKTGRFKVLKEKDSFNLRISNAEPSDSATYYCSVTYYADTALADWTVLVLKGRCSSSSLSAVLQPPVSDPVELGGDTTLQCSILTDASAGDHSVYWFRHGSGESHPGIIYTHGNRSDECKKSSETVDSPTQSCVYKLPKTNLSLSDAGTYYCAVLMCGQILFILCNECLLTFLKLFVLFVFTIFIIIFAFFSQSLSVQQLQSSLPWLWFYLCLENYTTVIINVSLPLKLILLFSFFC
uniref:Ig-like domain-containing protein n=1 Tax=Pygocentrus nattereri TaxID=42514 RepID=A0A3B4CJQ1_PYGNA